ncbi:MAG TPA: glycosyl hydrolase [Syntrophorhabdaceae bacterium]|nr:glycosyl hydrolase [Syntrophorhabdaceae bacterium]
MKIISIFQHGTKRTFLAAFWAFLVALWAVECPAFFGAKFEPPDGKTLHCAQAEVRPKSTKLISVDWSGLEEYVEASGKRPKLIMHYISFDERAFALLKPTIAEISQKKFDYIPQIGLDFYIYGEPADILRPVDITQKIAQGAYDDHIHVLAEMFKNMGTPAFIRPGYEFGGSGHGRFASKTYWAQAWRRIYDIFQQDDAKNVAFVWNTLDAADFIDYYPGDDCVDWWGINVFINHADRDTFINDFIREAKAHKKPVMIAESTPRYVGSVGGREAWVNWYQPYFNLIYRYPHVKAFCYINASWEGYPDQSFASDCRIQNNQIVLERYRTVLSDKNFIHAEEK